MGEGFVRRVGARTMVASLGLGLALVSLGGCTARDVPQKVPVAGGWSAASPTDAGVLAAAQAATSQLGPAGATLKRVLAAQQQVVAGLNYQLDLMLTDGSRWRVTVWRRLDGGHELTSSQRL